MRIEFHLESKDKDELSLAEDFCKLLVSNIKEDILRYTNYNKLELYEDSLINSNWINWKHKPSSINMKKLIKYIANSITYKSGRKHKYVIYIKSTIMLPNSYTPLERVARFLDKGNEIYRGTFFISKIFMKYRANIKKYWRSYISIKLKKLSVSEVVLIK